MSSYNCFIYAAMVAHILVVSLSFSKILSFFLSHMYEYTYSHLLIVERKTLWIITCLISSLHPCFHKKLLKTNFSYQHYFQINHFEHLNGRISSSILIFHKNGLWNILILLLWWYLSLSSPVMVNDWDPCFNTWHSTSWQDFLKHFSIRSHNSDSSSSNVSSSVFPFIL